MTKKRKKYEIGICPFCGSEDITYHDSEPEDEYYKYEVTCNQCDKEYNEVYELKFCFHTDEDGNIIE